MAYDGASQKPIKVFPGITISLYTIGTLTWDPEQQLVSGGGNVKESWKRAEIAYETPFPPSPRPPTPLTEQLALAGKGGGKRWDETELLINIMT